MKFKDINSEKMFAYFAPDGEIQTRSIQPTKKMCRTAICAREYHTWQTDKDRDGLSVTWQDYEKNGFVMKQIIFSAIVID